MKILIVFLLLVLYISFFYFYIGHIEEPEPAAAEPQWTREDLKAYKQESRQEYHRRKKELRKAKRSN